MSDNLTTALHKEKPRILKMTGKLLIYVAACFVIFGPLSGLVLWSFAEKWHWPGLVPQQFGPAYWVRAFKGDMMTSLVTGVKIAVITTIIVVLVSVPLAYVLARYSIPCKTVIMMLFLLPQAFPSLPIFANLSVLFYKWDIAGKLPGVLLVHIGAAFIYSIWTMVSVFQSIPKVLEEAANSMGASSIRTFFDVALPLAVPGIFASSLLVFLYSLDEFTGTLIIGSPFVKTLPVQMYTSSMGYELQIASVTSLIITVPGILLLLCFERFMKAEYLSSFGRL
jgi:putative spermidine/putrescine transport system permease protein